MPLCSRFLVHGMITPMRRRQLRASRCSAGGDTVTM
jgi:hypothetical protein